MNAPRQPRNWVVIFGVTVLTVGVLVLVAFLSATLLGGDFKDVAAECAQDGQPRLGDDGQTLTVTSGDGANAGAATTVSTCVLVELDAPDSVRSKVAGTTAMMGRQSDTWGDFELTWTYHPDNGLEIIVERD